jgi:hypothetical protein
MGKRGIRDPSRVSSDPSPIMLSHHVLPSCSPISQLLQAVRYDVLAAPPSPNTRSRSHIFDIRQDQSPGSYHDQLQDGYVVSYRVGFCNGTWRVGTRVIGFTPDAITVSRRWSNLRRGGWRVGVYQGLDMDWQWGEGKHLTPSMSGVLRT